MKLTYIPYNIETKELENNLLIGCMDGDTSLLKETLDLAKYYNITPDLSYDEGLLAVIAAQGGYTDALKILDEYDPSLIKNYGTELLSQAAVNGKTDCVKFLLSKQIDPTPLKSTSAYNNYVEVERIFEHYLDQHDKDFKIEELGNNHYYDTGLEG